MGGVGADEYVGCGELVVGAGGEGEIGVVKFVGADLYGLVGGQGELAFDCVALGCDGDENENHTEVGESGATPV